MIILKEKKEKCREITSCGIFLWLIDFYILI